jgi:hypothetical protein
VLSRISLAAALFVLLAAEWTDLDPLRHVSFGLLLIGLLSWRRTWPWYIFPSAFFVWVMTLPATFEILVNMGLRDTTALAWRLIGFFLGMVILIAAVVRYRPQPALGTYDNYGWQPIKRLAFTLLALVLVFQTASSFWPESTGKISADIFREDGRLVSVPKSNRPDGVTEVRYWRSTREGEDFNLLIARPTNVPFELHAPELILKGWGWRIVKRRLIQHATGQAVELQLRRGDQHGTALYWFEHGDRAFTNFLRGRQILWSGWNLMRRDLRLIMLYSEKEQDPKHLTRFAESEEWFRHTSKSAE